MSEWIGKVRKVGNSLVVTVSKKYTDFQIGDIVKVTMIKKGGIE